MSEITPALTAGAVLMLIVGLAIGVEIGMRLFRRGLRAQRKRLAAGAPLLRRMHWR